jgi:hypothetical protein
MKRYRNIKLFDEDSQDLDEYMHEILDRRKQEAEEALVEAENTIEEYSSNEDAED